jgi:preprotein translocase subunit SecG
MSKIFNKIVLFVAALFINIIVFAQDKTDSVSSTVTTSGSADDFMRSNNKIYVVMAVCITILVALILYLIRIDRKVTKLEKLQ